MRPELREGTHPLSVKKHMKFTRTIDNFSGNGPRHKNNGCLRSLEDSILYFNYDLGFLRSLISSTTTIHQFHVIT